MAFLGSTIRLLLALCWLAALPLQALAQGSGGTPQAESNPRRVALVIGNNGYESGPLTNSINDARAMAGVLREAGFTVMLHTDVDQRQFQLALREFGERLKAAGSGGAGLFYYAGHGVQIKGRNFLIPVRSHIAHEDEVAYAAVDAQAVLDKMESAGSGTNIVILDACRNNPCARSYRSGQQGLAQMDAPVGTLVAYATAPGAVAIDSQRGLSNGLYTTHLLEAIRKPGLKVEDVLKQTRNAVLRASGNKQMPWEASALVGDFYFHPPREGAPPAALAAAPVPAAPAVQPAATAAVDTQLAIDEALWEAVKDSRSSAELYAYLQRFPNGRHARDARRRLLDLSAPATRVTQPLAAETAPALPGLPSPPPRQALPVGSGTLTLPAPGDTVEESVRWGPHVASSRPDNPRRNAAGFAEGDRFRYQKTDHFVNGSHGVTDYLWRIDRVEPDGGLWVNAGRQRLDAAGQRAGGNDEHTGAWVEYSPPLPVVEMARLGAGAAQPVATTVSVRDADGRVERISLRGTVRTATDTTRGPRGMADLLSAVRVEFELAGEGQRSDGVRRQFRWVHTYWMALPLLLPVSMQIVEAADELPRQNTRHDLIAIDQLSLADVAPVGRR
ncbi:MAG: caspase family protein [Rubrivivax sp.]|nr:caspase family protein [Rubrivivax sp.]